MFVAEVHPFARLRPPMGHRAEHRLEARRLRAELGRRPTGEEYRALRRAVAAMRRARQASA